MQCDICFRAGGSKLPFLCATDARNQLYEHRIQNAQVLLEKDVLDREITSLLAATSSSGGGTGKKGAQVPAGREQIDDMAAERERAADRTRQIIAHADELRAKVKQAKADMAKRKAHLERRRSELATASSGIENRRRRQLEEVEQSIRRKRYSWNKDHAGLASSRTFLCGEAAKLYGLRKIKKNGGPEHYVIGRVGIVDLRAMNTASPAQISTALSHIVHLLMLAMHYLAIRLPAEIILPHKDYPLPTIFPIASSHLFKDVPFPGSTPGHSSNTSPTASRHAEQAKLPRPRPLFISKPLPILATEDPAAHALFIEGVTLLAYDVAWVCKSQGISVGDDTSFDDICNIGRNLYNLLIGTLKRPGPASRAPSTQSTPSKGGRDSEAEDNKSNPEPLMGRYSHGTAQAFLGGAEGTEFIRSWKLTSPRKLADELKARLMSEVANAEWEVLDEDAWAVDDGIGNDGVVVGARHEATNRGLQLGMQSFMSMKTVMDAVEMVGGGGDVERKTGTSGWTKLKSR